MKTILVLLSLLLMTPLICRGEGDASVLDQKARRHKIAQLSKTLRAFQPVADTKRVPVNLHPQNIYKGAEYAIRSDGLIEMDSESWVYIVSSSSHEHPEAGDIILAIDSEGRIFECDSHVCGGIMYFAAEEKIAAANPEDFFTRFFSDEDHKAWIMK